MMRLREPWIVILSPFCRFWFLNDWKNNIVQMLVELEETDENFVRCTTLIFSLP